MVELAAEHAELLPERMTLAVIENGRATGTGDNTPVNSPGGNNAISGNSGMVQTVGNAGAFIESNVSGDTFINQR
jgi:hypothetical protein